MNQAREHEMAVFEAALQLPADQRAAYLEKSCGADAGLRRRVEDLLGAADRAGDFMRQSAVPEPNVTLRLPPTEKPGDTIGRYKLLEQIGEGGCGVVYMAEQQEPVRRRVALKIIKLGMDTKSVIARFEAERQALALMDHPNIAKVLDAGTTDTGRPFFVMELVHGIRITDYCDQNNLPTAERLKLFTQICQAIQHAHQKGIIHRDIKPSNILVTLHDGLPVPKVIDFGIAKATTDQRLTDKTLFTHFEQFIGTPAYMSPEQAERSGLDIDTRSDIYSLGVLLYELLTGKTPFDANELLQAGLEEMRRTIREQEPARPSTKLSTLQAADLTEIARHRQAEPARLTSLIRGDLDWIVMKALEKDRTRRYETANGLATDVQRHLNNEPVVACPPSRIYRFRKTVQRNKLAFGAAAAVFIVLAAGVFISTMEAVRARRAEQKAEQAQQEQIRLLLAAQEAEQEQNRLRQAAQTAQTNEMIMSRRLESRLQLAQARNFINAGKLREAEKILDEIHLDSIEQTNGESAEINTGRTEIRRLLVEGCVKKHDWTNAVANLADLVRDGGKTWDSRIAVDNFEYGIALVIANDLSTYESYRRAVVADKLGGSDFEGEVFSLTFLLLKPADTNLLKDLEEFAAHAAKPGTNINSFRLSLFAYRKGDVTNALQFANDNLFNRNNDPTIPASAHTVKAMALFQMEQVDEARRELDLAKKAVDPEIENGVFKNIQNIFRMFEWAQARILLDEAERMIGPRSAPPK